jgi:hypothetical protein
VKFLPYFTNNTHVLKKKPAFKNKIHEADYIDLLQKVQLLIKQSNSNSAAEAKGIIASIEYDVSPGFTSSHLRLAQEFGDFENLLYAYEKTMNFDGLPDHLAKASELISAGTKVSTR